MAIRFRKSIKLAPGIRLNLSKNGLSLTAGVRGASLNFGSRGTYMNTGIPGTGFYSRERISVPQKSKQKTSYRTISIKVDDELGVLYQDCNGNRLPPDQVALAKQQNAAGIKQMVKETCDEINARQDCLTRLHYFTPPPSAPKYQPLPFDEASPIKPAIRGLGLLGRLFAGFKKRIEANNLRLVQNYDNALAQWQIRKQEYERIQDANRSLIEEEVKTNLNAMEKVLEGSLTDILWPRETNVEFDIRDGGKSVWLDVDLPEITDMPTKLASLTGRGFEFEYIENSETKIRQLYMQHIHSIGFRLIGEAFAVLPTCTTVILSGYSQRAEKTTGHITDQYLYSVKINREEWQKNNFENIKSIDVVATFEKYELRRDMTKTGLFKAILPFK